MGKSGAVMGQISQHIVEFRWATLHMASTHQIQQMQPNDLTSKGQYVGVIGAAGLRPTLCSLARFGENMAKMT